MKSWKKFLIAGLILGGAFCSKNISEYPLPKQNLSLEEITNRINYSRVRNLNALYKFSEEDLQKFNSWVDSTLNESARERKNCILVDKSSRLLYLIKNGEVDSEYIIELGRNPYDDKQFEGDCCTPEGLYIVQEKFENSNFYRAFLIDYPNSKDKEKGKTGGSIEIHGGGGSRKDWTLGCIALTNGNMDKIFPYLKKGDRITIVRYTSKKPSP